VTVLTGPEERFQEFLRTFQPEKGEYKYRRRLGQLRSLGQHYVVVDFEDLVAYDSELARLLVDKPDEYLPYIERSGWAQLKIEDPQYAEEIKKIRVRFRKLPDRYSLRKVGQAQLGKLLLVDGIIVRATPVRPLVTRAAFQCRKCNSLTFVEQSGLVMREPELCGRCRSKLLDFAEKQSIFINSQELRMQERPEDLPPGQLPRAIDVKLFEDLVDVARPGDRISLTGIVRAQQEMLGRGTPLRTFDLFLDANFLDISGKETEIVEITTEEETQILEMAKDPWIHRKLLSSLAPSIYGYDAIKEAILYLLFGAVHKILPDGVTIRGDVNVLLVGDPGCLVADERVVLGNGAIVKIGELGAEHLQDIQVQVLTGQGGAKRDIATRFHIYRNQPILELITESGKSIKGTYNHPLLVICRQNARLERHWKRLDEIRLGDKVAVVTGFPCTVRACVDTGFVPQERRFGPKFKGRLPNKLTPELAALLGYMTGDGWVQRYRIGFQVVETERDILPWLRGLVSDLFGLEAAVVKRRRPDRTLWVYEVTLRSEDVASNLSFLREKRIPDLVLRSNNEVVSSYLRWLFEADGSVFDKGRGSRAITLKAKDIELLRDVQILLLRFGIHSRIIENALLIRRGEDIIRFAKSIGFASKKKRTRLAKLVVSAKGFQRVHGQRSERVVKILRHPSQDVYDIEVPRSHRFIVNGIISHNTAKSQLLQYVARVAPRGLYTSGRGSTAAGLTAAVVREKSGGLVLEAGALVLADKGVCSIDEIDKMRPDDRVAIHEAMEQQSYHPSVEIMLGSGQKVRIGEFVDRLLEEHSAAKILGKDCEILPISRCGLRLVTTPDFSRFETASVDRVSRHVAPNEFTQIRYSNGREVLITPEHPVFVYRHGQILTVEASEVKVGDFVPGPRTLDLPSSAEHLVAPVVHHNEKIITLPSSLTADLGGIMGYLITEGYSYRGSASEIGFANTTQAFIREMNQLMKNTFSVVPLDYLHAARTQRYISSRLYRYFETNFPTMLGRAPIKRAPTAMMNAPPGVVRAFLCSAFKGDGSVEREALCYRTSSRELAEDYQDLLLRLGISSRLLKDRYNDSFKVCISGDSLPSFIHQLVDRKDPRYEKINHLLARSCRTLRGHDVLPTDVARDLIALQRLVGVSNDGYFHEHIRNGYGVTRKVLRKRLRELEARIAHLHRGIPSELTIRSLRQLLGWSQAEAARILGVRRGTIDYAERGGYTDGFRQTVLEMERRYALDSIAVARTGVDRLKAMSTSNIRWLRVRNVRSMPNAGRLRTKWVYDLTVEPTHNFVSHGVVLHNTVSIAKGGIVATLNARASVLAAANPALGRYEPYRNITENINLPVTILSRFDLIFIMRDAPDSEADTKMSEHILTLHRVGAPPQEVPVTPQMFRKYVSYARGIDPVLTEEASKALRDFYLRMRSTSTTAESPIAITPRQLEALVRLSECRARSFLRDKVTVEDTDAIIRLMTISLQHVGIDTSTGRVDIDVIMTGKPKSLRDRMQTILSTVAVMERETGTVQESKLYEELSKTAGLSEGEVQTLVNQLIRDGILYSPKPGHLKRTAA
jgi:replicative DNA helicase Mcm